MESFTRWDPELAAADSDWHEAHKKYRREQHRKMRSVNPLYGRSKREQARWYARHGFPPAVKGDSLPPERKYLSPPTRDPSRRRGAPKPKQQPDDDSGWQAEWVERVFAWVLDTVCALTGSANLQGGTNEAAHIYPKALLADPAEKWDAKNGFFLRRDIHRWYDLGYLALTDDGVWLFGPALPREEIILAGLNPDKTYRVNPEWWTERHAYFAKKHREGKYAETNDLVGEVAA